MSAPKWRRYLRFWRSNVDADLDDEFRFHFETEVEDLVATGVPPEAARAEALSRFGDVNLHRRDCRSADQRRLGRERRTEHLSVLAQDLRYALRSTMKDADRVMVSYPNYLDCARASAGSRTSLASASFSRST